jgi:hypothetical protein
MLADCVYRAYVANHPALYMQRRLIDATKGIALHWTKRLPLFWIALLSCMTSVLIIVVILQYRWTKQLSEASEARLVTILQPLVIGWHLDFYGELSAICVALQVDPGSGARDNWDDYLHRYVNWSHAPIHPGSVENIYANPGVVKSVCVWQTAGSATPHPWRRRITMQQDRSGQDTTPSLDDAFVGPAVIFCTFKRVAEIRGVDRVDLLAHPCAVPLSSNSWKPDGRRAEIYYDCAI